MTSVLAEVIVETLAAKFEKYGCVLEKVIKDKTDTLERNSTPAAFALR